MFKLNELRGPIYSKYFSAVPNWGDLVGPYLINRLTGLKVAKLRIGWREHLVTVGSILSDCNRFSIVWGTGFISEASRFKQMPKRICAVRGRYTQRLVREFGYRGNVALGDPAILMPEYYFPKVEKKFEIGFVPHYIDANQPEILALKKMGIKVLDISGSVEGFVDELLACESIFSSSLHGLIAADSYGLKSKWVRGSENIIGGDFKFHDYYSSIGVENEKPLLREDLLSKSLVELKECMWKKEMNISTDSLKAAFPLPIL